MATNTQSSSTQSQIVTESTLQQVNVKNNSLLVALTTSVLLTTIVVGSIVYFWQKLAREKEVSLLWEKIHSLEKQVSTMKSATIALQPTLSSPMTNTVDNWVSYIDSKLGFEFKYPQNLKPLKLSNGVVTFLPQENYDLCKKAQESRDMNALKPCYEAVFTFNGYQINPPQSYEEYIKDIKDFATLSSFTDGKNRTWNTSLVLGQVYNFDAFTQIDNTTIHISFQYGFNAPSEQEILSFFNHILSTFQLKNPVKRKSTSNHKP